jgi:hypothetical protein
MRPCTKDARLGLVTVRPDTAAVRLNTEAARPSGEGVRQDTASACLASLSGQQRDDATGKAAQRLDHFETAVTVAVTTADAEAMVAAMVYRCPRCKSRDRLALLCFTTNRSAWGAGHEL